ncbi:MAG TPA: AsmA family protein [Nitrospirales bacterium]
MKKFLIGFAVFILVLILIAVVLPFVVDLNTYQARYLPLIEESLNRKVTLKDLRLTILPRLGVHITEFTVMDDPLFGTSPFATLRSLDVGVKLIPLLRGRVEIDQIIIREPSVTVIKNSLGLLNISTLGRKLPQQPKEPQEKEAGAAPLQLLSLLAVDRLSVSNGHVAYRNATSMPPAEYSVEKFQVLIQGVGLGLTPALHVSGELKPLSLPVKIDGTLGPIRENLDIGTFVFDVLLGKALVEIKGSALEGHVRFSASSPEITSTDLPLALPLTKPLQVKNLHLEGEAKDSTINIGALDAIIPLGKDIVTVKGSYIGGEAKLKMTAPALTSTDLPLSLPVTKPIDITNLIAIAEVKPPHARLQNLSLEVFGGQLRAELEAKSGVIPIPFSGKTAAQGIQLGPLMQAFGTDKLSISGTAAAEMDMRGIGVTMPELNKGLEGAGHLLIKDGRIEGINLLKEAAALLNAIGITNDSGNATLFSRIESNLRVQQGIIVIERLIANSPDFDATGKGAIGFDKTLNLNLSLILSEALSKEISGFSPVGKAMTVRGRLSVPMIITGTTQAPRYALDTKALGSKVQEQVKEKLGELLKGQDGEDLLRQGEQTLKKLFGQ